MKKHLATAAAYGGITGKRTGTRYLYTEEEVTKYLDHLKALGRAAYLRRVTS